MGWHRAWGWGLAAGLGCGLHACADDFYSCFQDEQCERDGQSGRCFNPGFCAYPDDACDDGLRFSPNASEDLAGRCVDIPFSGSSSGPPASMTTTFPPMSSSSDDGELEVCGNGIVEPSEDCDDGNREAGDGCSRDCWLAGTERWVQRYAGPAGADDRATALVVGAEGRVLVGGEQGESDDARSAIVLSYRMADGQAADEPWIDAGEPGDLRLHGMVSAPDRVAVVGERASGGPAGSRAWYAVLDLGLEPLALGAIDTLAPESGRGVADTPDGFVLVGAQDGRAWAHWFEAGRPDFVGAELLAVEAVGARVDGAFVVVGPTADEAMHWWMVSASGSLIREGTGEGDQAHMAGFDQLGRPVIGGVRDGMPWAEAHHLDGTLAWRLPEELEVTDGSVEAVARTSRGDVILAGIGEGVQGVQGGWVARLDVEGRLLWTGPVRPTAEVVRPYAALYVENELLDELSDEVLVVAGAERGPEGDFDLFVVAIEP